MRNFGFNYEFRLHYYAESELKQNFDPDALIDVPPNMAPSTARYDVNEYNVGETARPSSSSKPVAVVTASTAGIGLGIGHALAKAGYHVVISSRKPENVKMAVEQIQGQFGVDSASGLPCHVSEPEARSALVGHALQQGGKIEALVLNAAASTHIGPILETSESHWDKIFEVNVKSAFLLVQQFAPHLSAGASIVFISSIAAYNPLPGVGVYSVTKTALLGLTKTLANELAARRIRVNCVAPGIIKTSFSKGLWQGGKSLANSSISGKGKGAKYFHIPLGRIGEPDDVSGIVAFLVSPHAAYITGETIVAAGGAVSKL